MATKPDTTIHLAGPGARAGFLSPAHDLGLPLPFLSDSAKWDAAEHIATILRRRAEGPHANPDTWFTVARGFNIMCRTYYEKGGGGACYIPPSASASEVMGGIILVNLALVEREQAEAWVHELAHFVLYFWQPSILTGCADSWQYSDEQAEAHHEIARRVEWLIFSK